MFEQETLPSLKQAIGIDQDLLQRQQINGSNQVVRGWNKADLSEDAGSLMWQSNQAAVAGDMQTAARLRQQGTDLMRQAQQWAPTVENLTDVNSVESFGDWAGGALGNMRSSVKPALGGLAGAAVGGLGGALIGGVPGAAAGMNWGSRIGAGLAGYNTMTEGNAADMMMDSGITSSPQEIARAARGAGVVQGALESIVPAGVAGSVVGLGGRKAAAEIAKNGLLKTAGKRIGVDAAEEFATEFAQNPVGDIAKNYLKGDDLSNIDWKAAFNAGAAGAVGGGGMGAIGAGFDAAHAGLGRGVDTARDVASDPLGTVLDAGVDLAAKAGTLKAKVDNYFDERELKKAGLTQDEIDQGRLEQIQATLAGKSDLKSTSPLSDEENQMDDQSFNAHHENKLKEDAATILKAGRDSTEAEKSLASQYAAGQIDAVEFQTKLHQTQNDKVAEKETDALLTGLGQNTKKSEMRPDNEDEIAAGRAAVTDGLLTSDRMYIESELLKPEAQQQKINTLTDIMVKQGVDEKIVDATNGEQNRKQLAGLLRWVMDGTRDDPDAVKAIVNRFGENSATMFKKAYSLAKNNGLIKPHNEFAEEFTRRLEDASNVQSKLHKALKNNLSDIALHGVKDVDGAVKKLVPMIKTVVQEGMSAKVKQGLIDNFFGTEERLHNVMNAYIDTGEHKKLVSKATGGGKDQVEIDADGNVVPEQQFDEDGELIVNKYGAGASVSEIKGPKIVGFTNPKGRVGIPFNLGFDKGIEKYEAVKAQHSSELGNSVVSAGIWSRTKKDLKGDDAAIERAGFDLLASFGPKLMPKGEHADLIKGFSEGDVDIGDDAKAIGEADYELLKSFAKTQTPKGKYASLIKGFSEGTIDIGDLSKRQRAALLGQIDKQFRYLEVTKPDSGDSRHNIQDIDSFKWNPKDAKPETFTAQNGVLFLERNGSKGLTHFPVSTTSLFNQGVATENEGANGTTLEGKRRGSLGTSDRVMSALTDLMLAEGGNFTSRIGYRTAPGQPLQWVENLERLPKEMLLGRQHTVGDAKTQADIERREEKPTDAGIGFAENHKERVAALLELAKRESTSSGFAFMIHKKISKGAPTVLQFYRELRDQWQGSPDGFGGTPMSKKDITFARPATEYDTEKTTEMRRKGQKEGVPAPSEAQGRIEAEDGNVEEVHRGPDGARVGYGADAAGAGYEGPPSTRSREGTRADPARKVKRKGGDQIDARDWVAGLLQKGVPAFNAAMRKVALDQTVNDRVRVGFNALMSMSEQGVAEHILGDKTKLKEAATILARANEVRGDKYVVRNAGGKTETRGRGDAVAGLGSAEVRAASDQHGGFTGPDVGTGTQGGTSGEQAGTGDEVNVRNDERTGETGVRGRPNALGRRNATVIDSLGNNSGSSTKTNVGSSKVGDSASTTSSPSEHNQRGALGANSKGPTDDSSGGGRSAAIERNSVHKSGEFGNREETPAGTNLGSSSNPQGKAGSGGAGSQSQKTDGRNVRGAAGDFDSSVSQRTERAMEQGSGSGRAEGSGVGQDGPSPKTSGESVGARNSTLRGASAAPVGQRPSEQHNLAQQLQAYVDQHSTKNVPWANAARKAIDSNNEKQITGALAAAKRQFGEVNGENHYFSSENPVSGRVAALAEKEFDIFSAHRKNAKQAITPLNLAKFHKLAKTYPNYDFLSYTGAQSKPRVRQVMSGVKSYLKEKGFGVIDEFVLYKPPGSAVSTQFNDHGIVGLTAKSLGALVRPRTVVDGANAMLTLLHEATHSIDIATLSTANGTKTMASIMNDGFEKYGVYTAEAVAVWKGDNEYNHTFDYPFDAHFANLHPLRVKAEIFAQLNSIYHLDPEWSKVNTPEFHKFAEKIKNDKTGYVDWIIGGYATRSDFIDDFNDAYGTSHPKELEGTDKGAGGTGVSASFGQPWTNVVGRPKNGQGNPEGNTGGVKPSAQTPNANPKSKEEFEASVVQAGAHILFTLGKNVKVAFEKMTNGSGSWTEGQTMNTIKLALNGDVLGAAFHESFHEFVNILEKNGGKASVDVMKRAAMNPIIQRKLERLLDGHPEAIKQLANHEEAAAFMYQFWQAGALKIGPETKSIFQMIKNGLKRVAAVFSETFRKEVEAMSREQLEAGHAELLMRQFSEGAVANADTRAAVVAAINKDTDAHNAAVERVGETFQNFANAAGKLVFSNEAMMDATNNKHMVDIARGFHQKIGTAMRKVGSSYGSYSDGLRQATSHWVHKVENILDGYSPEDIEMARKAMSTETEPTDRVAKELVAKINTFYSEMAGYMAEKGVKRLNMDRIDSDTGMKGVWEDIPLRKNYLPQVWSIDALMGDMAGFKESLLKHHARELQHIADEANKEVKAVKLPEKGTAARAEFDRAGGGTLNTITAEMVADAIATRLLASNGHIEISESNSGLGITPASSAVNKRELNWLDKDVFDKYKEKDLTSIMTTYAHSIVKRGEYQSRFGPDGGKIAEGADKAVLFELGGDALVEQAEKGLEAARKKWSKQKAAVGDDFSEPFPTLRSVGQDMHVAGVGQEKHDAALLKAMGKLDNSFKAIQALEGTLGREISPNARAVSSWIVTYQSFRLMATSLFTNFQDVVGLVVNGGEAKDAWTGFVEGIREIRNTIFDKKDPSAAVADAEFWGTVDSGAYLESTAQAQGSPFMSGKAKVLSDKLFKYNGMVGWNRGVRAAATQVAVRIISGWAKNGIDTNDKAAVSRMEDLFGKGFDPKNIKFGPDGNLEKNAANQAAVTRWVLTAVAAPTAAHRTIWMSDPHYAVFAQLKSYSYSFHRVMMKNAADQARLGNYRPVMAMGLGYMPIAIAAGAIKEMLIPGEEPPWMKGGLDGYLQYGFGRAGVLGVPQMMLGNLVDVSEIPGLNFGKAGAAFDPATLAGPTVDQLQNILSVPFGEFMAMRDHTVIGEGLGALPGGSMLRRLERLGNA